ncbi:DNA/RNA helicases [Amycolatopsis camponoti]|uniref:DNA/RNA helicases n=1 Tax=Amycolatopsis camponoti TaxID=2606593 RepID=A0A6I8LPE7_9PSEU|nr:helicase-related protein [Amycolatopsis camponoti]VVJ19634.1 DNA/RNA helicases [Amycolatopsis camponoti]
MTMTEFRPGTLVAARGREWLVLPGSPAGMLLARPLGGRDDETTVLLPDQDSPTAATFDVPSVDDRGDAARARLLRDALRLSFRATAGPFRSFAQLAVTPRNYQLVPLMMAAAQDTVRLLIADGVGVGKTIEAGLIAAELIASGDAQRLAVLCSPQLAPQWQSELRTKFGINAELLLPSTANRLARSVPFGSTVYEHYPYLIISTDYIKQHSRRDEFALLCPELVIVDEAHTCIAPTSTVGSSHAHQRYILLRKLADDQSRHLLLLTATPHNGDDGAWQRLVGLLDDRFAELPVDLSGPDRDDDRKLLAKFLIQRQRADIRDYLSEETPFPTRERAEESYKLTPAYRKLFDRVLSYAHEQVADPSIGHVRRRVRWWSAIALLRSIASSPAAAEQTLLNRSQLDDAQSVEDADSVAGPRVFDVDLDDTVDGDDTALGAAISTSDGPQASARRRLRGFAAEAAALRGVKFDAKLKRVVAIVSALVADGYHPIVFCRYIPTTEYVAEHLATALRKLPGIRVEAVSGTLPPEERESRVQDLTAHPGPRVLVSTDCLSEGVNLQEGFTAVVHYDLAWNPTRHEQREGRIDRFGQTAKTVRAVTYYGADNKIDGVVLDVLLRRHESIRRTTGVSVPVPVDSTTVMNAIWESLLLRGTDPQQLSLDLGAATDSETADAVLTRWIDAAEREKASRSRFRQAALHPDEVEATLADVRRSLGGPADAERFTRDALALLSGQLTDTDDGFIVRIDTLPHALVDQLPATKASALRFHRSLPVPPGEPLLARTDPTVEALARYVLDAALDPLLPDVARPARRAAVIRTTAVDTVTTLLVVRFRVELVIPGSRRTITQVAEDAQFLGFTVHNGLVRWLDPATTDTLLLARPTANVRDDLARGQLQHALDRLPELQAHLGVRGKSIATEAVKAHRAVRRSSHVALRGLQARLLPPPDVLGVYLYLPDRTT